MKWSSIFVSFIIYNVVRSDDIKPLVGFFDKLIHDLGYDNLRVELDKLSNDNTSINGTEVLEKLSNAIKAKFNTTKKALRKLRDATERHHRASREHIADAEKDMQEFLGCCDVDANIHNFNQQSEDDYTGCHLHNYGSATTPSRDAQRFYKEAAKVMKEYLVDSKLDAFSNFFYATINGAFYLYPARKLESCVTFDPRKRSWYAESSTLHSKDVVIAIDVSGSMEMVNIQGQSLLDIVKIGATMVVNTLNVNDRVGVVAFSNDVVIPPDFECYKRELAVATPQNKQCINKFINSLRGKDLTNYVAGLERAFYYFSNSLPTTDEHRDRILLFLSDGMPTVGGEWENVSQIINKNCAGNDITLLTYGIGKALQDEQNKELLTKMARSCPGERGDRDNLTEITSPNDMLNSIANYYVDLHHYKDREEPIFTLPYLDAGGLGLILSMCLPVQNDGKFIGVVCTDIQIADLLDDVINFHQGKMSYAFLINQYGQTYFHPLLPTPTSLLESTGPVDIDALERDPAVREIIKSMKNEEKGMKELETQRTVSHGSTQIEGVEVIWAKTIYQWTPVEGYNFSVCIVIAADEHTVIFPDQSVSKFVYHDFRKQDIFKQYYFKNGLCSMNDKIVYTRHSGVKFAPSLYKNPADYRKGNESSVNVTEFINYLKNATNSSTILESSVRGAVAFTSVVENTWKESNEQSFIWRYVATVDGVLRLLPATKLNKLYDPRNHFWFQRAVNNKGITILTAPYLDNLGTGYIVSIGKAVCKKECQRYNIHAPVAAAVGGDLSIYHLYDQLGQLVPVCRRRNRCILVDHSGYIVMHDAFIYPKSIQASPIQFVHLSVKEPNITRMLLNDGILRIKACMDILSIKNNYYWQMRGMEPRHHQEFSVYPVIGTNVFLIVKASNAVIPLVQSCDDVKTFIRLMSPSRHFEEGHISCQAAWENGEICNCSCSSPANFDPCPNTFDYRQFSDLWPTCVPGSQNIDMSKVKDRDSLQFKQCKNICENQQNSSECYKAEDCLWCTINKSGEKLEKPFCTESSYCYFGIVGHRGPYGESASQFREETVTEDSSLVIVLICVAVILIIISFLAFAYFIYKKKKFRLPRSIDDKSQLLGCQLRTSIVDMERDNPSMVWGNIMDRSSTISSRSKEQISLRKMERPHSSSSDSIAYLAQKVEALVHRLDSAQDTPLHNHSFQSHCCSTRRTNRPSSIPSEFSTLPRSTSFTSALSSRSSTLDSLGSCNYPPSRSSTLPRSTLHLAPFPEEQILDPSVLLANQVTVRRTPTERTCHTCICRQPSERTWPPGETVEARNPYFNVKREPSEKSFRGDEWLDVKRTCSVCRSSSLPSDARRPTGTYTPIYLRHKSSVVRRRKRNSHVHSNRSSSSSSQLAAAVIESSIKKCLEDLAAEEQKGAEAAGGETEIEQVAASKEEDTDDISENEFSNAEKLNSDIEYTASDVEKSKSA